MVSRHSNQDCYLYSSLNLLDFKKKVAVELDFILCFRLINRNYAEIKNHVLPKTYYIEVLDFFLHVSLFGKIVMTFEVTRKDYVKRIYIYPSQTNFQSCIYILNVCLFHLSARVI
jgi:hypothetical protein